VRGANVRLNSGSRCARDKGTEAGKTQGLLPAPEGGLSEVRNDGAGC
jgi:hypothetical protein